MAKIPTIRRLSVEDFKEQKSWIEPLFDVLNQFILSVVTALNRRLTISENMLAQVAQVAVQTMNSWTISDDQPTSLVNTFVDADVNTGTDILTITGHGLETGYQVQLTTTGVLPSPLAIDTDYWVIYMSANTLQLAASYADALAGTPINITSAAGGGTHTVTRWIEGPAYVPLYERPKISITFKSAPILVMVGNIIEVQNNPEVIRQPVSIDCQFSGNQITINHVSGLLPSRKYQMTLAIFGG